MIAPNNYMTIQSDFRQKLSEISSASYLVVNKDTGQLTSTDFFSFIFEKIKGFFHHPDWSNKRLIEYTVIRDLQKGAELLNAESDIELILAVAQKCNLIDKISNPGHDDFEQLIQAIGA